jgi:hypothetical protein
MDIHARIPHRAAALVLVAGTLLPAIACAQAPRANPDSGKWQYAFSINGYLPSIAGNTTFPVDSGSSIDITADKIIENLKFTFMGSLDVNNGRWGAFTDVLYLDVGGSKSQSRDFSIGNLGLPAGTNADLSLDVKGLVWTLAGEYRLANDPGLTMDLLAGARYFDLKQKLGWAISGSLGPIAAPGRTGSVEVRENVWDAIVGVKGRYAFGESARWSVPFYVDVGTGQSDLTWQGSAGIGYAFQWGEVSVLWRYLDYRFKSRKIEDMNFNGPQIGATFRW